jgi:ubiquinol-cytochrome c reductase cytochrome b subunit
MTTGPQQEHQSETGPVPAGGFFGSRTGWRELKQHILLEPVKGGSRWAAAFGSLLLFNFVLQIFTGILLTMNYAPSTVTAWQSVKYINEEVPLGWFVRRMHHWGSSAMVILLLFHLLQVYIWGAYKRPRELTWMTGVLLLAATLGLAFTGYLLPWDERAYWASKVGLGIAGTVPIVGESVRRLMQGGPDMGNLTLTRFFTLHGFVLPGALIALVSVHLYLFRLHGVTTAWWESKAELIEKQEPFWPGQVWKDAVCAFVFLALLVAWCMYHPAPLEGIADPSKPYEARPEWYFMFLFQLLKYFHGPYEVVGTFVLPSLFFAILFFWPLLDRNPSRDPRKRPFAIGLVSFATLALVGTTVWAIKSDTRMTNPVEAMAPAGQPAAPLQKLNAAKLYATSCLPCHGADGTGNQLRIAMPTIPNFTDTAWQKTQTDEQFRKQIHDGKENAMPAFKDKLNADQIQVLTQFVRVFGNKTPAVR